MGALAYAEEVKGVKTPHWFKKNCIVCLQNLLYKPCSLNPKFYAENLRNCTLISHFTSASRGLRPPWTPYQGFVPGPHCGTSVLQTPGPPPPREPLHCKIMCMPMDGCASNLQNADPSSCSQWCRLHRTRGYMPPLLQIAGHELGYRE